MVIYISGAISHTFNYKSTFKRAERKLLDMGHIPLNPADTIMGLTQEDYMHISYAMIDCAEAIYVTSGSSNSKGTQLEIEYAKEHGKKIIYEYE